MGKKGSGNSWLTAVKRAFRSPTKDSEKKSCRRKLEQQHEDLDEEKKTEFRRKWLFRKHSSSNNNGQVVLNEAKITTTVPAEQRHAIAVAAATAAAAEAAVATAKAAVEIIRLTQPAAAASKTTTSTSLKQHSAAKLIQTAFRGYLARRALIALKGIVKLQALIRGQNVRKQANMTMKCMQALLRVQARVRDQRSRLSHDGGRRSMFAESTNLWESRYLKDIRERTSRSRDGSCVTDDWRDCPRTLEELEAILKARNEAALRNDNSLAFAFSQQNKRWDSDKIPYNGDEYEVVENRANSLDKSIPSKQWEITSRASTDHRRSDSIKTVEIDSLKTSSSSSYSHRRKSHCQSPIHTRSTPRATTPQYRPSSPRRQKEEKSYSTANTPVLRSTPRPVSRVVINNDVNNNINATVPNYMTATASAKARIRSQSAPRQRASTPERERNGGGSMAKKRLSYPIPEPYCVNFGFGCSGLSQNLRSPSFKSVQAGYVGMEQHSNYSCYTDSVGGEISPCSTTDLRRWLR